MSTDTKYQVMGELLGIMPAAIEKAEEQASRIIGIVQGGWTKEAIDECAFPPGFAASLKVQPFTPEDLSYLKDRGHTWAEIGAEAGISQDAARKRVEKWRAKQSAIEPHIEKAWQDAEETIRKPKTVDEFIQERIAAGDLDYEIWQAVKRNFPGISMDVADISSRRQAA